MATVPKLSEEMTADDWRRLREESLKLSLNNRCHCVVQSSERVGVGRSPKQALHDHDQRAAA